MSTRTVETKYIGAMGDTVAVGELTFILDIRILEALWTGATGAHSLSSYTCSWIILADVVIRTAACAVCLFPGAICFQSESSVVIKGDVHASDNNATRESQLTFVMYTSNIDIMVYFCAWETFESHASVE